MNETLEDELERANHERIQIVRKYKLGRNIENQINEWVRNIVNRPVISILTSLHLCRRTQNLDFITRLTGD